MVYKTKKHIFLKREVDSLYHRVLYSSCRVSLKRLTAEDIENFKLNLIKKKIKKEDGYTSKDNYTLKDNKTSRSDKRPKYDKKSKNAKTSKDTKTSKNAKTSKDTKTSKDAKTIKVENTSNDNILSIISIDDEPAKKKQKVDTNGVDVLKLVLSREGETDKFKSQFKSSLKPNKGIASTSTEEEPIVIDCDEFTESANSSAINIKGRVWAKDLKKMMSADNYIKWQKMINYDPKLNHPKNGTKKLPVAILPINGPKVVGLKHALNGKKYVKGHLVKIEKLYKKYFSKSVQDTIVVIANILNIISMSNKHHKARMDESFKKRTEAEKLKERCDANRLHGRHKKVLETKLKNNFIDVVSSFEVSEFDSGFQMFFLSILTVLRVLDQPKFRKGSIFKNLVLLLWNSLKNSDYNNPKIFSMFRSKTFRPDCIDLISLIEDSRDIDPGVTERMSLFFVSTVNSREYFQAVIDAVTGDSNEDLALLIDNATFLCSVNSKFKDPVDSPPAQYLNDKTPATETIPSLVNSDEIIQHWFLAKNPDGTYQQIPVINANTTQTICNTAVKPSIVTSQPLNNFYQSFSSSLQKKTFEPSTSKVIPPNKCFVVTPNISHSSLVQVSASLSKPTISIPASTTTLVTLKPSIQNKLSVASGTLHRAEGSTIVVGNKQYQLVKGPASQMRAIINGNNTFIKPMPTKITKCFAKNCNRSATIMCSNCTLAKYCSHTCQRLDWYDSHINDCDQLLKKK